MAEDSGGGAHKIPVGPTGLRVMANVKRLRQAKGMTYKDLSQRLTRLGRPIPVLGLSRMEKGERRVDADDLVALAIALDCAPSKLLLPELDPPGSPAMHSLTPQGTEGSAIELWEWAIGEAPLPGTPPAESSDSVLDFMSSNAPHHFHWPLDIDEAFSAPRIPGNPSGKLGIDVMAALAAGVPRSGVRSTVELAIYMSEIAEPVRFINIRETSLRRMKEEAIQLASENRTRESDVEELRLLIERMKADHDERD